MLSTDYIISVTTDDYFLGTHSSIKLEEKIQGLCLDSLDGEGADHSPLRWSRGLCASLASHSHGVWGVFPAPLGDKVTETGESSESMFPFT